MLEASFAAPVAEPTPVVLEAAELVAQAAETSEPKPIIWEQTRLTPAEVATDAGANRFEVIVVNESLPAESAATELRRADAAAKSAPSSQESPPPAETAARAVAQPQPVASLAAVPEAPGVRSPTTANWALNPPPVYPPLALSQGWHGTSLLRVWIDATGRIEMVEVERSSGFEILDDAAVAAVQRWKARPATRFGAAIASVELQAIVFLPRRS